MQCVTTHNLLVPVRAVDEFVVQSLRVIELPTLTHILSLVCECGHGGHIFACAKVWWSWVTRLGAMPNHLSKILPSNSRFRSRCSSFASQADDVVHLLPLGDWWVSFSASLGRGVWIRYENDNSRLLSYVPKCDLVFWVFDWWFGDAVYEWWSMDCNFLFINRGT